MITFWRNLFRPKPQWIWECPRCGNQAMFSESGPIRYFCPSCTGRMVCLGRETR